MSGVFLIVAHDDQYENPTVLRSTHGGYPHVTLFYSGKHYDMETLYFRGRRAFWEIMQGGEDNANLLLTAENVKLNSFFHEGKGKQRYDVLLHLDKKGTEMIEKLRSSVLQESKEIFESKLSMGPPHVTHSIHWNEAEARASLEEVKKHLPLEVAITGYTID